MEGYTTENEQLEALKKWWEQNAKWIIGGLVIAALIVGGWRIYGYWQSKRAAEAAGLYAAVVQAEGKNDTAAVASSAKKLIKAYPATAYGALGGLALAKAQFAQQHLDDAVRSLQGVVAHSPDKGLAMIARLRIARIQLEQGKAREALDTLKHQGQGAFSATVQGLRGEAFEQLGRTQDARTAYQAGLKATKATSGLHQLLSLRLANLPSGKHAAAGASGTAAPAGKPANSATSTGVTS